MMIEELAQTHASRRLTRKQRNADLWRHGFDPDGPDGERYRAAFERAIAASTSNAAGQQHRQQQRIATIWRCPERDFEALRALMGKPVAGGEFHDWTIVTHAQYESRIQALAERAVEQGADAVFAVDMPLQEMNAALVERGLPFDEAGTAAVVIDFARSRVRPRTRPGLVIGAGSIGHALVNLGWVSDDAKVVLLAPPPRPEEEIGRDEA